MLKRLLHAQIRKMERQYGYDASYMHDVLDASLPAFLKFGLFQIMSMHRDQVPKDAWYAARLAAALSEDCGPCSQILVDMALGDGVPPSVLSALLRGDCDTAGADASLGYRYGMAVAQNKMEAVELAAEAVTRFGKRGAVSLDFAVASSRVYPTVKRGLGHGAACTRLIVSGEPFTMKQTA